MEHARSIFKDCNLPIYLWKEAISHANYLIICSPTWANSGETPENKYSGTKQDLSNLKFLGCLAHVHIPKVDRRKLNNKTLSCLFLRHDSESKAYRLYDKTRWKVIINRDVVFDETKVGHQFIQGPQISTSFFESPLLSSTKTPIIETQQLEIPEDANHLEFVDVDNSQTELVIQNQEQSSPENRPRSPRPLPIDRQAGPAVRRYLSQNRAPSIRLRDH